MPEMNYSRKLQRWSLLDAEMAGQLLAITCQFCNTKHFHKPGDFLKFRDNMSLAKLIGKMRCETCKRKDYMHIDIHHPYGDDFGKLKVRRLVEVRTVKLPVWKDVTL
jgi:hypothetical protein